MSNEIFKIIFEEFKKNGIKLNDFEYRGDTFVAAPLDIFNHPILREGETQPLLDFTEHDKPFKDEISKLEEKIHRLREERREIRKRCASDGELHMFDVKRYCGLRIVSKDVIAENAELKKRISELDMISDENKKLKQRIAELESEKAENFEEKTISDDTRPSAEWYENRYQQDCITINRLNTTIDVLIHKIEHLRQFAGLE